jgi:hypothetical protein
LVNELLKPFYSFYSNLYYFYSFGSISSILKLKLTGIFLILALILPFAGTFLVHKIQKKQIKRAIKWKIIAGIDKSELVFLKFTEKEKQTKLRWEHAKEFEYQGQMYDVTDYQTIGDTTYYWCWWDYEETNLNKQLNKKLSESLEGNPQNHERQLKLFSFLNSLFWDQIQIFIPKNFFFLSASGFIYSRRHYSTLLFSESPPP